MTSNNLYVYAYHLGEHDYRYCGLTSRDPVEHLHQYYTQARLSPSDRPLFKWLKTFEGDVHVHVLETLEADSSDEMRKQREQYWIDRLRAEQYRLLNVHRSSYRIKARKPRKIKLPNQPIKAFRWPAETIAQKFRRSPYFPMENGLYTMRKPNN